MAEAWLGLGAGEEGASGINYPHLHREVPGSAPWQSRREREGRQGFRVRVRPRCVREQSPLCVPCKHQAGDLSPSIPQAGTCLGCVTDASCCLQLLSEGWVPARVTPLGWVGGL